MPEITVVIPTLGTRPSLGRVLDRLDGEAERGTDFETVVVGSGAVVPLEQVRRLAGDRRFPVQVLDRDGSGVSSARNAGWRAAGTRLVLFLDDDVLPSPGLLAQHLSWHRDAPASEVGVLGHVRWAPEVRVTPFMRWLEHGVQFDYVNIRGTDAGWGRFYTANISLKRAILERVGGFDEEELPFMYEDLDLGYRLNHLGFRLLYNRRAVGDHLHVTDLDEWRRRVRLIAPAERRFVSLHPDVKPYFHRMFSTAASRPRARGRGTRLVGVVPRWVPWLGPRVWASADLFFRQALAPHFLDAWEAAPTGQ
jgi:GT2 family glycosyltransferase